MSLIEVAILQFVAAVIGVAVQLFESRHVRAGMSAVGGRRVLGGVVGLMLALVIWDAICIFAKLLTWKPFAGDLPGSVEVTAVLLFTGSAAAGFFATKWLFRQASRAESQ